MPLYELITTITNVSVGVYVCIIGVLCIIIGALSLERVFDKRKPNKNTKRKICVQCRWHVSKPNIEHACMHPRHYITRICPVTGKVRTEIKSRTPSCHLLNKKGKCKDWEPKKDVTKKQEESN